MRTMFCLALIGLLYPSTVSGADVVVNDLSSLRKALSELTPDTTLKIGPGDYAGGHYVKNVSGLTVEALDPKNPPHFKGGPNAWHFSRCHDLTLRSIRISGQSNNGLNLDDGGLFDQPVTGITIEKVEISDIGRNGNFDGIKCSGLDQLVIRDSSVTGWGGQGIDMVGCHDVLIERCRFVGKPGFSATAGVQTKGGSSDVTVTNCEFINAGQRPLNVGGSTGLTLFRPSGAKYEAKQIVVKNNRIEGSLCAAVFVGVDGAEFSGNTILFPEKWIFRILQETNVEGFTPTQNVTIKDNRIVFRRADIQTEVNIGGGTRPETFTFERNRWYAEDRPLASKPRLPSSEVDGVYGIDPRE